MTFANQVFSSRLILLLLTLHKTSRAKFRIVSLNRFSVIFVFEFGPLSFEATRLNLVGGVWADSLTVKVYFGLEVEGLAADLWVNLELNVVGCCLPSEFQFRLQILGVNSVQVLGTLLAGAGFSLLRPNVSLLNNSAV